MVNPSETRKAIHSLIGRGVTTPQVEQLAQALVGQKVAAGHALMNEGDRTSGMSLITDRPSSATVVAVSECELQVLTRAQFQRLIEGDSIAAYKLVMTIAGVLAERLAKLDRKIIELTGHWNL